VDRLSIRARSDIGLKIEIRRVFYENLQVYGVRKVWRRLQREGFVYVAFIIDAFARRIVGQVGLARAGFVLDALDQALHDRRPVHRGGLVHHSDCGSQYVSIRYSNGWLRRTSSRLSGRQPVIEWPREPELRHDPTNEEENRKLSNPMTPASPASHGDYHCFKPSSAA
jgi:hypothetical protein